jgi:predicted transcriptional regulator
MLTKLLALLDESRAYSEQELAKVLGVRTETVLAQIEYLERLGMLQRVSVGGGCAGGCKNCSSGCKPQGGSPLVMWEKPIEERA